MKHLKAAAEFAAACIEVAEILALGAACLLVIALTPDEDTQADLPDEPRALTAEERRQLLMHILTEHAAREFSRELAGDDFDKAVTAAWLREVL